MMTLDAAREKLATVLAETSTAFWSVDERNGYIQQAQNRIAYITKGVPHYFSVAVDPSSPAIKLSRTIIGTYATGIYVVGGRELSPLPLAQLARLDPGWRTRAGSPRWVVIEPAKGTLLPAPTPTSSITLEGAVAVLPATLSNGADLLLDNELTMEPYQTGLLYLAATYALLKDRDPDVQMFYEFFKQELTELGVDPDDIPSIASLLEPGDSK